MHTVQAQCDSTRRAGILFCRALGRDAHLDERFLIYTALLQFLDRLTVAAHTSQRSSVTPTQENHIV